MIISFINDQNIIKKEKQHGHFGQYWDDDDDNDDESVMIMMIMIKVPGL